MRKLKRTRAKRLIMDVGSSAVRICELTQTKTGYQLTSYHQRDFPIDPAMEEEEKRQIRADVVKQLLKDAKVRTKKTIFGLPGQSIFNRTRALPPVPEHKVTQIVRYEIQQQIPFSLDQIAFDYQVLQRTEAGGYDVLMAAIKVDVVEKHLALLHDIKRQVDIVDVAPLATYNWLKDTHELGEEGECVAIIDLGATTTDIVIERGNQFRFARPLSIGGNDITAAISKVFGMGFLEAEKLKRERGFAPTGDAQRDGKGGEVIGEALGRLVSEITRTFAYFRSQPGGGPVSRVILCGGGACLRNIVHYLQRELGLEVRIAQPLAGLSIGPNALEINEHPEQACVALGLALRCCQSVAIEINLIPPRITEAARRREQAFYWALSLATLVLILASIIPVSARKHRAVLEEISHLRQLMGLYDYTLTAGTDDPSLVRSPYEKDLDEKVGIVKGYEAGMRLLNGVDAMRIPWLKYFAAIADARPKGKGIWFRSVQSAVISSRVGGAAPAGGGANQRERGREGRRSLLTGAGEKGASGPSSGAPGIDVVGFPGIEPPSGSSSSGMGGGSRDRDRGREGGRQTQEAAPATLRKPNGLTVIGYAVDPDAISRFVDALKASGVFQNVYFDQSSANRVPISDLDNAGAMPSYEAPRSSADGRGMAGLSLGAQSGMSSYVPPGGAVVAISGEGTIATFRIDVLYGTLAAPPAPQARPSAAAPARTRTTEEGAAAEAEGAGSGKRPRLGAAGAGQSEQQ